VSGLQYPSPVRLTSRGKALLVVAALLAAVGVIPHQANLAAAFAGGLGLVSLLIYWRLVGVARGAAVSRLEVKRRVLGERVEGSDLEVEIVVRNPTPIAFEHVEIYDSPPALWETEGQPRITVFIPPLSQLRLSYRVKPVYGLHEFGPIRVNVYDPLGLFTYSLEVGEKEVVRIKPKPISRMRGAYLIPSSPRPGGSSPGRRRGVGTIFYDVREYAPGDDLRFVDWKGYARTRRLYVKQFEQEVQVNTVIVFDATETMFMGARGETKAENTARVVRSVLEYIAWRGDNYMLAVITPDGKLRSTPWLRGRAGLPIALDILSSVKWPLEAAMTPQKSAPVVSDEELRLMPGSRRASKLAGLYRQVGREKTLFFLFTDFYESAAVARSYARVLEKLRMLRHEVQVLIPLTHYFEIQLLGGGIEASFYTIMALEKLQEYFDILKLLRRKGIAALATGPVKLAESVLEKLERYRRLLS